MRDSDPFQLALGLYSPWLVQKNQMWAYPTSASVVRCRARIYIVKLLLHRGAHVNAKDGSGFRTLKIAINRGHSNVVQLQKLYGAKEQSRIADANFQREERMRGQAYILAALLIFLMSPVGFVEQTGADESTEKEQVAKKVTALIELIRDAKAEEFQELAFRTWIEGFHRAFLCGCEKGVVRAVFV